MSLLYLQNLEIVTLTYPYLQNLVIATLKCPYLQNLEIVTLTYNLTYRTLKLLPWHVLTCEHIEVSNYSYPSFYIRENRACC